MKKPIVFKPIDINDKIDKIDEYVFLALIISFIPTFLSICLSVIITTVTHTDKHWLLYLLSINLAITTITGITAMITDRIYDAKYYLIGHQLKNGINYWEELGKLKEASNGKKSSSKKK